MEVCKGESAPDESDMDVPHKDALLIVCSAGGHCPVTVERGEHVGVRNAKVRAPFRDTYPMYFDCRSLTRACRFYCWGPSKPPMQMTPNEAVDWNAHLQTPVIFNHHEPLVINESSIKRVDLNPILSTPKAVSNEERVLILTPLRDAAPYLQKYFDLLSDLTYPHHLIDLGFLVGDCTDDTLAVLSAELARIQKTTDTLSEPFNSALIIEKDFGIVTAQSVEERHGFKAQAPRRKNMARARNYLLTSALKPEHSWVYWRDVDIVDSPKKILEDFVAHDRDIIVPSTLHNVEIGKH